MKNYLVEDRIIKIPTCWQDIKFKTYMEIAKLEKAKGAYQFEELYLMKFVETMCEVEQGDLDDLTIEQINEIASGMTFLGDTLDFPVRTHMEIAGVDYVLPKDINKLTMGEYISIKTLQEKIGDEVAVLPYILAIILRPGIKVVDSETGKEMWKQNKFDAENIEYRKNLFLEQSVADLMGAVNFFLSGNKTFTNNIKDYTQEA